MLTISIYSISYNVINDNKRYDFTFVVTSFTSRSTLPFYQQVAGRVSTPPMSAFTSSLFFAMKRKPAVLLYYGFTSGVRFRFVTGKGNQNCQLVLAVDSNLLIFQWFVDISVLDKLKLINYYYYSESLSVNLTTMKPETKERVQVVVNILKTGFNWGFIPVVIILGNIYINDLAGPF